MKLTKSGTSFFDIKKNSSSSEFPNLFTNYLLSHGETYFWEKGNFHVVTKAAHAKEILTSSAYSADRGSFFISRMPNLDLRLIGDFFSVVKKMMVMSDDADHLKKRKLAGLGFEDHILDKFTEKMHLTIKTLLSGLKERQSFDFSEEVAKKLPSTVLADLFSIPENDRPQFLKWSMTMTGFFGGASEYRNEDGIEVNQAALNLKNYFSQLIEQRRQSFGEDYVSILVRMQKVIGLSDEDLISQLIMMLVAGMATTTDQINNIMFLLAERIDLQKDLKDNPSLIPQAIEEMKRFDPAVTFIFRVAREKTMIGNQPIEVGDVIFISTHAINRDLPANESPFEINIHRKAQHFAYGHGPHYCIGAKLGRMEMQCLFQEILSSLPLFELDSEKEAVRDHYSLSFSGFKALPLRFLAGHSASEGTKI